MRYNPLSEIPSWFEEWTSDQPWSDEVPDEGKREEARVWMHGRPEVMRRLMVRFPPSCVVKANRPLRCPSPGGYGVVVSYFEPQDDCPDGLLSVVADPHKEGIRHQCQPEWLEVVGYWCGFTPDTMRKLLFN